jgi:hypothetical protein
MRERPASDCARGEQHPQIARVFAVKGKWLELIVRGDRNPAACIALEQQQ